MSEGVKICQAIIPFPADVRVDVVTDYPTELFGMAVIVNWLSELEQIEMVRLWSGAYNEALAAGAPDDFAGASADYDANGLRYTRLSAKQAKEIEEERPGAEMCEAPWKW